MSISSCRLKTKKTFKKKVLWIIAKIPRGKTLSYKEVANKAGNPGAWRAVGSILNKNINPKIPCHRVICADGNLGGYNRGKREKKRILEKEGFLKVNKKQ
jgi:methylated-DNA-[protein]-cysteine S-methyltransferase